MMWFRKGQEKRYPVIRQSPQSFPCTASILSRGLVFFKEKERAGDSPSVPLFCSCTSQFKTLEQLCTEGITLFPLFKKEMVAVFDGMKQVLSATSMSPFSACFSHLWQTDRISASCNELQNIVQWVVIFLKQYFHIIYKHSIQLQSEYLARVMLQCSFIPPHGFSNRKTKASIVNPPKHIYVTFILTTKELNSKQMCLDWIRWTVSNNLLSLTLERFPQITPVWKEAS